MIPASHFGDLNHAATANLNAAASARTGACPRRGRLQLHPLPHAAVLHLLLVIFSGIRSDFPWAEGRPWPGPGNGTSVQDAATHRDGPAVGASDYGGARGDAGADDPDAGSACARRA